MPKPRAAAKRPESEKIIPKLGFADLGKIDLLVRKGAEVFSPGIWWIGSRMNLSGSDVQILQMYS